MLKSKNISLRAVEPIDVDFLFHLENDSSIWRVSGTSVPFSRKTLEDYANSYHDITTQKQFRFVICDRNIPVGLIDLFDYDSINARCGIGIVIDEKHRNKSIGTLALELLIEHSTKNLNLKQLYCSIHSSNKSSIDLFIKLNFTEAGVRKQWYVNNNEWEDENLYQLILR